MNPVERAMTAYGQAAQTLPPLQQIVLLYDGAIRRIKEARGAIAQRRVSERYTAVTKAAAIIDGLQSGLDHERGGEIAHNLDRLYTYMTFRLQSLNLTGDITVCDELIARLSELRASWAQLGASGGAGERANGTQRAAVAAGQTASKAGRALTT